MELPQFYETTVLETEYGFGLHFISIPRRSLTKSAQSGDAIEAMKLLDVKPHCRILEARAAHALLALLEIESERDKRIESLDRLAAEQPEAFEFARAVASSSEIPIEQSPLSGEILTTLLQASTVGVGAALGFIASGGGPLLFVYIPAGIIIVDVARGIGGGLRKGLEERIARAIKGGEKVGKRKKKEKEGETGS